ncbi:type II secretion system protein [Desulfosoma caldarium]|uniref:Prepilin-type N-terminal cleavage/methylation domain-containing protein n=1 Tax=Desulfosoma caldarium TaxID=610254 RepID=A0A3N1ULS0_9BACT|nr:prepilin-type N-terminal cleavage/methylation domain-containing protein [Desulfosoma caldarium]ROQ90658.1 prepilin-type N-terminal cleavage/methylation domain-containing protein [Desulfosoma caldarium]
MKGKGSDQRGFTLVELAIVLVVIGLILGTVLKGQEIINNAKIKQLYNDYRGVFAAVYTYYDRYHKYPGDDHKASKRWPGAKDGNHDGKIGAGDDILTNCTDSSDNETCTAWEHMRMAGLIPGAGRENPLHAYGGVIGIGYMDGSGSIPEGHWILLTDVPGDVGQGLDEHYDDGEYDCGTIRASMMYDNATVDFYLKL